MTVDRIHVLSNHLIESGRCGSAKFMSPFCALVVQAMHGDDIDAESRLHAVEMWDYSVRLGFVDC